MTTVNPPDPEPPPKIKYHSLHTQYNRDKQSNSQYTQYCSQHHYDTSTTSHSIHTKSLRSIPSTMDNQGIYVSLLHLLQILTIRTQNNQQLIQVIRTRLQGLCANRPRRGADYKMGVTAGMRGLSRTRQQTRALPQSQRHPVRSSRNTNPNYRV